MGLDMYLERMPRYKNTTPAEVSALSQYFTWVFEKKDPKSNAKKHTLKEWCGVDYKNVPTGDVRKFYKQHHKMEYWDWDKEHKYGLHGRLAEQVGYWRKANQIHSWFVDNVQDGVDDCEYHHEVTKEILEQLLEICKKVLASCELVNGEITNGYTFNQDGTKNPIIEDGKYVKDPSVAMGLLPSTSGFFFGSTDYDEFYVDDIKLTIDIITKVLETTDFETQMIYYVSSW
jgi:hypothetical protein